MEGCNNFCSFCVVPYVRGREESRPAIEILEEIKGLDKSIFKEVVLLGQNVNSYKGRETGNALRVTRYGLAQLLKDIHGIDGIERIRFLTSHPRDMSDDIIDAVRELPKVCEYFHLPLQSGDDQILKAMNRGYTSDNYRKLVEKIRKKIPEASITSDAIAGFPGETDGQFENTLKLISELELDLVNTFTYSPRPGTAAEKLPGQLPEEVRSQRLRRLMDVVEVTAGRKNKRLAGTIQEVLVERKKNNRLSGRTRGNTLVKFESEKDLTGKTVNVRITAPAPFVLEGEPVS
jgi:tRNA-2-methylthio-N6-dimethylallyladenosine synthase